MNEKPILFSVPMVRAILCGRKTQTRRVVGGVNDVGVYEVCGRFYYLGHQIRCPYTLRQRLWVRESFFVLPVLWSSSHDVQPIHYAADIQESAQVEGYVKKPSIHLPRWASRLTLEITSVRVECVQDISDGDARAEGVTDRAEFARLWDALNAKRGYAFEQNPWVWVISFTRVQP